ncbi:MAG: PilZ domain-containing protein [Planctomycetes bacterium]|nr:PilZ domain-containing protein [Planctomycetota bacterium]
MVQKRNHRVAAARTRARVAGRDVPVVNLSLGGACLALEGPLPADAEVELELEHPHLPERTALRGEVVWSRAPQAGVRFVGLEAAQRTHLRRCMLAEYGHGVWASPSAERPVGYVAPIGPGRWGLFDQAVRQVGELRRDGAMLVLQADGQGSLTVPGVPEAAMRCFGLPRHPRLHPPLELDPPAPAPAAPSDAPSLSGSAVLDGARVVGYVARTGESWSFFDAAREPLGFMTVGQDGAWRVVVLGDNEDGSLDLRRAGSYPDALAAAFALTEPPGLRSTVFQPTHLLDA